MPFKVVYIDDEVDTDKEMIKIEWLSKNGVDITPVKFVSDALEVLRRVRPDVLLLDVLMPPYDVYSLQETKNGTDTGLRLLRDVRKEFPDLPVIVITVKAPVEVEPELEALGADGYLYKPVLGVDILEEILSVVKDRRSR